MTNIEKVEKLREKADVNYADAKDALERSEWEILDAMILLEKEGKVPTQQKIVEVEYTTREEEPQAEPASAAAGSRPGIGELLGKFFRWLGKLIRIGNANEFIVDKGDEAVLGVPVTVFVVLTVFCFWAVIPILIIGLFFGYRYSFSGPNLGKDVINNVMQKASNVAEGIREEIKEELKDKSDK